MKRSFGFFGIACLLLLTFFNVSLAQSYKISKVVIDAGHGGRDPGCLGSKTKEKDVTLSIALKLGGLIKKNFPEVKVVYTRNTDVLVELFKRARIANESKADLFISIHCNANPSENPYGAETYVMGLHKSQANLEIAQKENASIFMEDSYSNNYDGFDPASTEAYIIFSLYQNAYLDQSLGLATKVQAQMKEKAGMSDRGVKQAGFLVLYKTAMPSILIETGFLSNLKDESFLSSAKGQELIALGIYKAFKTYKNELEGNTTLSNQNELKSKDTDVTYQQIVNDTAVTAKDTSIKVIKKNEIVFKVQFAASSVKKPVNSPDFKGLKDVQTYFNKGLYKYVTGSEPTPDSAMTLLEKVRGMGFKDAFLVAFLNGERISPQEAMKLIKKN
ncbi:MAG: N-acetylmuramoyl-L-alanine amidase [Bacteroidales bacterium]